MSTTSKTTANPTVAMLLTLLDEAYSCKSWHGTNLRGAVRGLSAAQAGWRLPAGGHSIADIVTHCAYWKYTVRRRLRGEPRGSFPLAGSNWFELPAELSAQEWKGCVALLHEQHQQLVAAVGALRPRELAQTAPGGKVKIGMLVRGAALHDVYHAGQIQSIKGQGKRGEVAT